MEDDLSKANSLGKLQGPFEQNDPTLLDLIRSKFIDKPSFKPYNLSTDFRFIFQKKGYNPEHLKKISKVLFANQRNGFFVEAGALDGQFISNTLWLEQELGWTGLLVEPNPVSYRALLRKNRRAWSSNTCLSAKPYPYQATFVDVSVNRDYNKAMHGHFPLIFKGASHLLEVNISDAYKAFLKKTSSQYFKVQCMPLTSLLLALNRTKIDLLSLDIQGSEKAVLETVPLDRIHIKALIVEHYAPVHPDPELIKIFKDRDYKLIFCGGEPDYVLIKRTEFQHVHLPEITKCQKG